MEWKDMVCIAKRALVFSLPSLFSARFILPADQLTLDMLQIYRHDSPAHAGGHTSANLKV
eukprot:scaffold1549_cov350-Prasinococcus_capsulatus_cf.AAC.12